MRSFVPWRLGIEHLTAFVYDEPARASYNEVRMIPRSTQRQLVLQTTTATAPLSAQYRYTDYWGTEVIAFDVPQPHTTLEIRAAAIVDTGLPPAHPPDAAWSEVLEARDRFVEMLQPTPYTRADDRLEAAADTLHRATPRETVDAVLGWTDDMVAYEPGSTSVHTSAPEVVAAGCGVCQDRAHVALALLRRLGIPARYVSGYLHPHVEPSVGETVDGQSHAWIEVWTGGWWEVDPTNGGVVDRRHVLVARGRDYGDVAPLKGIYAGSAEHAMAPVVSVTRQA